MKVDGHRMIMWRTGDGVRLQARPGRDVTAACGDLALAGHHLPAGTVLDGEAVIATEDGRIKLLAGLPVNTPIQAVSATTDRRTALTWYNSLHHQGVEGIVATPPCRRAPYGAGTTSPSRAGRTGAGLKIRHADTIDATAVGFTGTARRPRALAVRLPHGCVALSQRLTTTLATRIAPRLIPQPEHAYTQGGDAYTPVSGQVVVEVVAGTTRHAVVTVIHPRREGVFSRCFIP